MDSRATSIGDFPFKPSVERAVKCMTSPYPIFTFVPFGKTVKNQSSLFFVSTRGSVTDGLSNHSSLGLPSAPQLMLI